MGLASPMAFTLLFSLFISTHAVAGESIMVGDFGNNDLSSWQTNSFVGETRYKSEAGKLTAIASASASGLVKKIHIDLNKTPFLNWSWKVEKSSLLESPTHHEREKAGDDYPVRIYIVIDGGWAFWRTLALNYVWSANQQVGTSWENAYTSNAIMLAVDSGKEAAGTWQHHKRNLKEDLKQYLGIEVEQIDAVAIMSDTDNTGGTTEAAYGNIFFSSD
jgi:hypothetical protein